MNNLLIDLLRLLRKEKPKLTDDLVRWLMYRDWYQLNTEKDLHKFMYELAEILLEEN